MAKSMDIAGNEVKIKILAKITPIENGEFDVITTVRKTRMDGAPNIGWAGITVKGSEEYLKQQRARIVTAMRTGKAPDDDA